jgi:hypothetical protein
MTNPQNHPQLEMPKGFVITHEAKVVGLKVSEMLIFRKKTRQRNFASRSFHYPCAMFLFF